MENDINNLLAKLAIAEIDQLSLTDNNEPYQKMVELGKKYQDKYQDIPISEIPGVNKSRDLFKKIGIDPTKRRPSSESLLRRGLKDKGFFSINLLVDIGNWCSLEFLLPICVYDSDSIKGRLIGRIGKEGDGYIAIDNKYLDLNGRYLISDENGALGSPIKDSLRTKVTNLTKSAKLLIYAPHYMKDKELFDYHQIFIDRVLSYCGGELKSQYLALTEKEE